MNWHRESPLVMQSDEGYRISKFIVSGQAFYRASLDGQFIAPSVRTFDDAKAQCDRHKESSQ